MNDFSKIKRDFPLFTTYPDLVYLDSAATSQKPQQVIDAVLNFYTSSNANVHRGIYDLSQKATDLFEGAREKIARFINSNKLEEIVFTSNASAGINYVASGWAKKHLQAGDVIVLSEMEHHSNIVPWVRLKEEIGIKIVYLPVCRHSGEPAQRVTPESVPSRCWTSQHDDMGGDADFRLDYQALLHLDIPKEKIKLVALTHASNVLGTINPIAEIVSFYKQNGIQAKFLIDAAQSIPHLPVDVKQLDCDFLVFSSHKMLGPSGVGVLWAKQELLEDMDPFFVGSHMISTVSKEKATWQDVPHKFETGTGALEGIVGLGAAVDYINTIGLEKIAAHEQELTRYGLEKLSAIEGLTLFGPTDEENRLAVFSFAVGNIHAHDVAEVLNRKHIAIRSGHHCAQVMMERLSTPATARASFYIYNTKEDIDWLMEGIEEVKATFNRNPKY